MPDAGNLSISEASSADAVQLTELARRTFRDTFGSVNTRSDMETYLERSFSLEAVSRDLDDPANTFLVAFLESGGEPIGYAKLKTGTPDPTVSGPGPIEIERLYVGREGLGRGIGAALMNACLEHAIHAGFETIWLGVWEQNPRAIAFYRKWEFREVGEHSFLLGSDLQTDLIMERSVRQSSGTG